MTLPNREELAGRLVSDAEAMIAGRAILDAHGQWELENNRVGGQNPWQREHIMLLGRAALSAAALRQSPSVKEVAQIIRKHALSRSGEPCTPRESVTAAHAIVALYGGEDG